MNRCGVRAKVESVRSLLEDFRHFASAIKEIASGLEVSAASPGSAPAAA
jgi:hypothetical protein